MYTSTTIAALGVCGALGILLPTAAVILYKIRHKSAWGISVVIGAATFVVFAVILERLLNTVMLPIVKESTLWYCVYGALAAGVFEETGRYLAAKFLMKNKISTENAILAGLGHGGAEVVILLGVTMFSYMAMALYVNSAGMAEAVNTLANGDFELSLEVTAQLTSIKEFGFLNVLTVLYERLVAVTFHVCMSVWIFASVKKTVLFPAAIAAHALLDIPAVLFQRWIITSLPLLYSIMTVYTGVVVVVTVKFAKRFIRGYAVRGEIN